MAVGCSRHFYLIIYKRDFPCIFFLHVDYYGMTAIAFLINELIKRSKYRLNLDSLKFLFSFHKEWLNEFFFNKILNCHQQISIKYENRYSSNSFLLNHHYRQSIFFFFFELSRFFSSSSQNARRSTCNAYTNRLKNKME